jgi:membrane protein DedA with SNARE-associated domain
MDIVKLQKLHKPAGMALLLTGLAHGYLALSNRFVINHSGFVLWVVVLFAVGVGILKENSDNKKLRKVHIQYAILIIVALIYHYFLPGPLI